MQTEALPRSSAYERIRDLAYRLHLPVTLVKFLIVGAIAFLINEFFLFVFYDSPVAFFLPEDHTRVHLGLLTHPDIRLLIASILAVEVAIIFQFYSHENWTFRHRRRPGWLPVRFAKFNLSSIVSPIISVATINILTPAIRDAAGADSLAGVLAPYISNGLGVGLGFIWNWSVNSLVIWPHHKETLLDPAPADEPAAEELAAVYPVAPAPDEQDALAS
jgi:putative flippase GtrA